MMPLLRAAASGAVKTHLSGDGKQVPDLNLAGEGDGIDLCRRIADQRSKWLDILRER